MSLLVSGSKKIWWDSLSSNLSTLSSIEGQYLGPIEFILPLYIGDNFFEFLIIPCVSLFVYVMLQEICLLIFFLVKKEKKYGSSSAFCSSKLLKLIVRESRRGGVPVFNLPILKLNFLSCSLKPVEGFSSYLPAGVFFSPTKKTPYIKIQQHKNKK